MPYCSACDRSFREAQHLEQHLASPIHGFRCDTCQINFKDQKSLHKHKKYSVQHAKSTKTTLPKKNSSLSQPQPSRPVVPSTTQTPCADHADVVSSTSNAIRAPSYDDTTVSQYMQQQWSTIPFSTLSVEFDALSNRCHTSADLVKNGYRLQPYSAEYLAGLRRCKRCMVQRMKAQKRATTECRFHPGNLATRQKQKNPKPFPCCGATTYRGCTLLSTHDYAPLDIRLAAKYGSFATTPPRRLQSPKFRAVTLDCEMAGVIGGDNAVILICAADYFTGAVLLNQFILPSEKVVQWRTRIHGVKQSAVLAAASQGQALAGWKGAREALWKCIDADTILIGHALQHDLSVLRMIHTRVVDSAILTRNAVGLGNRQWGLQSLCEQLLQIEIRANAGDIHDCVEDVLATREVVLWCVRNQQLLMQWAGVKRQEEEVKRQQQEKLKQQKNDKKAEINKQRILGLSAEASAAHFGSDSEEEDEEESDTNGSEDDERLHWSDIAEDFGWPHPDTGYDPWSD